MVFCQSRPTDDVTCIFCHKVDQLKILPASCCHKVDQLKVLPIFFGHKVDQLKVLSVFYVTKSTSWKFSLPYVVTKSTNWRCYLYFSGLRRSFLRFLFMLYLTKRRLFMKYSLSLISNCKTHTNNSLSLITDWLICVNTVRSICANLLGMERWLTMANEIQCIILYITQ